MSFAGLRQLIVGLCEQDLSYLTASQNMAKRRWPSTSRASGLKRLSPRISYSPLDERQSQAFTWISSVLLGKCSMTRPLITLIDPDSLRRSNFAPFRTYRRAISTLVMAIVSQWRWCLQTPIVLEISRIVPGRISKTQRICSCPPSLMAPPRAP